MNEQTYVDIFMAAVNEDCIIARGKMDDLSYREIKMLILVAEDLVSWSRSNKLMRDIEASKSITKGYE